MSLTEWVPSRRDGWLTAIDPMSEKIGWGTDETRITTWPGLCPDDLP
jgi:hypothetical protein